jgi:hypothetical protein
MGVAWLRYGATVREHCLAQLGAGSAVVQRRKPGSGRLALTARNRAPLRLQQPDNAAALATPDVSHIAPPGAYLLRLTMTTWPRRRDSAPPRKQGAPPARLAEPAAPSPRTTRTVSRPCHKSLTSRDRSLTTCFGGKSQGCRPGPGKKFEQVRPGSQSRQEAAFLLVTEFSRPLPTSRVTAIRRNRSSEEAAFEEPVAVLCCCTSSRTNSNYVSDL